MRPAMTAISAIALPPPMTMLAMAVASAHNPSG
jgi:hypothetical protein